MIVARSAAEVLRTVEKFVGDDESSEPIISTFEGGHVDIDELRRVVADMEEL